MEQKVLSDWKGREETERQSAGREAAKRQSDREELLERIARLAGSYTPEWRFDRENPDAGTALALLFAEMFVGTIRRYAQIPDKHRSAFFEQIGLDIRPAQTAKGYVTFGLSSDEHGGTFLRKGVTMWGASVMTQESAYRTTEALYVTPAALTSVLFVDGERDYFALKDRSRCFAPFAAEEKNLQEHVFYLCRNDVLSVSGGAGILLSLEPYDSVESGGIPAWMLDREACSFFYSSEGGFTEYGERHVEEGRLVLCREEDSACAARMTVSGKEGYWIGCRYNKPWLEPAFSVKEIKVASRRENGLPDFIWNQTGEQENARFPPFGESPLPFAECYFASAEALGKPGACVTVSFWVDYEKLPFDHSYKPDRRWKMLMKRADFAPDPEYDITVEQVVWEYYNGVGWSRLAVGKKWEMLFDGTGARAGQEVRMSFVCPQDAALLSWHAAPTRYLRVRVLKMKNLYQPKGSYIVPVIGGVHISFDYEDGGRVPELVSVLNNRDSRLYETVKRDGEHEIWTLFKNREEKCPTLYFGFNRPLRNGPLRILFTLQEEFPGVLPCLKFSYSCTPEHSGVHECSGTHKFAPLSVVDETENFKKNGALTFYGKEDFSQCCLCGETAYWLCIQDVSGMHRIWEKQNKIPRIMGIFMNAARAEALPEEAEKYGGAAGNRSPGGIDRLNGSYGYVNRVANPLPFLGGSDGEEGVRALRRGSAALRHAGRAVTASDFEALAREASASVKKVRCFANCGGDGEEQPGAVTVVLLLKEFQDGRMYFDEVRAQVMRYLAGRTSGNLFSSGRLFVTEPFFLEMDCEVNAVISGQSSPFEVQEQIEKSMEQFLHPLTGNYDGSGWNIGMVPNETQMTNALKGIPGLLYIQNLRMTAYRNTGHERVRISLNTAAGEESRGGDRKCPARFMVPLPGKCKIVLRTEQA